MSLFTTFYPTLIIMASPRTTGYQCVLGHYLARLVIWPAVDLLVDRCKVDFGELKQLVEIVDNKVSFLKVVDAVIGLHHAL